MATGGISHDIEWLAGELLHWQMQHEAVWRCVKESRGKWDEKHAIRRLQRIDRKLNDLRRIEALLTKPK